MTSELRISPYTPIDKQNVLKAIYQLQHYEYQISNTRAPVNESLCNDMFDEIWLECIEQNGAILVAYQGESFVGFVQYFFSESTNCYKIPEVRKYALINNLCIMEEFRHLGFGKKLLHAVENAVRATGITNKVRIWALANNNQACMVYQNYGFQKVEIVLEKSLPEDYLENLKTNSILEHISPLNPFASFQFSTPLHLLQKWFQEALQLNANEPCGVVLSKLDINGKLVNRVVLLKIVDDTGIIVVNTVNSKKFTDISNDIAVSGTLWWRETMKQVCFTGQATKIPSSITDKFWEEKTRESQAITAILHQSDPMLDNEIMRQKVNDLINSQEIILRPETWCAYHIAIQDIEFSLGNQDKFFYRMHYKLDNEKWHYRKL